MVHELCTYHRTSSIHDFFVGWNKKLSHWDLKKERTSKITVIPLIIIKKKQNLKNCMAHYTVLFRRLLWLCTRRFDKQKGER